MAEKVIKAKFTAVVAVQTAEEDKIKTETHMTDGNASTYSFDWHEEFVSMWRDQMKNESLPSDGEINTTVIAKNY